MMRIQQIQIDLEDKLFNKQQQQEKKRRIANSSSLGNAAPVRQTTSSTTRSGASIKAATSPRTWLLTIVKAAEQQQHKKTLVEATEKQLEKERLELQAATPSNSSINNSTATGVTSSNGIPDISFSTKSESDVVVGSRDAVVAALGSVVHVPQTTTNAESHEVRNLQNSSNSSKVRERPQTGDQKSNENSKKQETAGATLSHESVRPEDEIEGCWELIDVVDEDPAPENPGKRPEATSVRKQSEKSIPKNKSNACKEQKREEIKFEIVIESRSGKKAKRKVRTQSKVPHQFKLQKEARPKPKKSPKTPHEKFKFCSTPLQREPALSLRLSPDNKPFGFRTPTTPLWQEKKKPKKLKTKEKEKHKRLHYQQEQPGPTESFTITNLGNSSILIHLNRLESRTYNGREAVELSKDGEDFYQGPQASTSMGLDILSKLLRIFRPDTNQQQTNNTGSKKINRHSASCSGANGEHLNISQRKRKARNSQDLDDSPFKYRRVDNRFPKFMPQTIDNDDDDVVFVQSSPGKPTFNIQTVSQSSQSQARKSSAKSRKSIFEEPKVATHVVKNNFYADVEFSDDEEPELLWGGHRENNALASSSRHMNLTHTGASREFNVPIQRTTESHRDKFVSYRRGDASTSGGYIGPLRFQSLANKAPSTRPSYAEALKCGVNMWNEAGGGHILNGRGSSMSTAMTNSSGRLLNGMGLGGGLNTSRSFNFMPSRSILSHENQTLDRLKYRQFLEQVAPKIYGPAERGPHTTQVHRTPDDPRVSSTARGTVRKSLQAQSKERSLMLSSFKRPPLSSTTINLVDDDKEEDDEVSVVGVTSLNGERIHHHRPMGRENRIKETISLIEDDGLVSGSSIDAKLNRFSFTEEKKKKAELPYVEPVNSLAEQFKTSPHLNDKWLEEFQARWDKAKKNRKREIEEAELEAERRTAERIANEKEILEKLRSISIPSFDLTPLEEITELEEEEVEFVPLTAKHHERIRQALTGPDNQVIVSKFNLNITRRDIRTLIGLNWLNDEVINFYMNLLTERGELKHESHGYPTVYAMNTFFVPRLLQSGHAGVRRWTRKVDIFAKDIIPVPVHVGNVHWCMAIIHLKNKTIRYYDSMGCANDTVLSALEQYLKDESMDKRKTPFDTSDFVIESVRDVPRQMNGSDCGVFSCMFAEYVTRGKPITFTQANMEYFRSKMIYEIAEGELLQ